MTSRLRCWNRPVVHRCFDAVEQQCQAFLLQTHQFADIRQIDRAVAERAGKAQGVGQQPGAILDFNPRLAG